MIAFKDIPVVWDNVEFLPYQSGAIAPQSVNGSAYITSQVRPHPRRSSSGNSYNFLLLDGHCDTWPQ
jgi:prepilin-type processing-associated H-X9-DG protein